MRQQDTRNGGRAPGTPNRLAGAASPYLLQHAGNPVNWYPWGPEAFDAARREDKPIFLSIGYSTCHWCHVMARESFEDPEVAALLNETFIAIKVDREERPDIDHVYMTVCQMVTGSGGWPLTIVMTPDKKPFFAATYIPKHTRLGRPGMLETIPRLRALWTDRRDDVVASAANFVRALGALGEPRRGEPLDGAVSATAYRQLAARYDERYGGFGGAPKFPTPHALLFLLRHARRTGDAKALAMAEHTVRAIASSGTFDQLGFGVHRYATTEDWKVPHFEKMLYDQALMLMACVETYQAGGDAVAAETARRIRTYLLRDLLAPEGGFYAAENAESEGVEGKFYLWRLAELREVLTPEEAALAETIYGLRASGNFSDEVGRDADGANILHQTASLDALVSEQGIAREELEADLETIRIKLLAARERRVRPSLDDKILTDWNGLTIAALAQAGRVMDDAVCVAAAERAAAFLLDRLSGDTLLHRYRQGEAGIRANADDYAFLIWGLLELYEAAFHVHHLAQAIRLQDEMVDHFWDDDAGGFFFTADDAEPLPVRRKEIYDGALPAANSVAMLNLLRLGRMTGRTDYEDRAQAIADAFAQAARELPSGHAMLMTAVDFAVGPTVEVVIAEGHDTDSARAMLSALNGVYFPNKVVLLRPPGEAPPITQLAPFTAGQTASNGQATAYVCRDYACASPTTDPRRMTGTVSAILIED